MSNKKPKTRAARSEVEKHGGARGFALAKALELIDPTSTSSGPPPPPVWKPFPGKPQEQAYYCEADELFYGGSAGGGKTALLIGLAATAHTKSIIFRREYPQLKEVIDQVRALTTEYNGSSKVATFPGNRMLELGAVQHEWDTKKYQGRPHDLLGFDEITEFSPGQYRFLQGWNRTTVRGQRCRIVCTGNPPTTADGRWVIEEWAPWLDDAFPNPAGPGELRWYWTNGDKTEWVDGPAPFEHEGETITPRSRTFIPAALADNPILDRTGYRATLQAMPKALRDALLHGNFKAAISDDLRQAIPTAWIKAAQARWRPDGGKGKPMTSLGVDVARGGLDKTVLTPRHDNWVGMPRKVPGVETPDGPSVAVLVHQDHDGSAEVCIDIINVGGSAYDCLKDHLGVLIIPVNNAEASDVYDRSGKFRLINVRAAGIWRLREALDPDHGDNLALPPDPELLADLSAPRYIVKPQGILIESKDDIKARLGRSPDVGDSVALTYSGTASRKKLSTGFFRVALSPLHRKDFHVGVVRTIDLPTMQPEQEGFLVVRLQDLPEDVPDRVTCLDVAGVDTVIFKVADLEGTGLPEFSDSKRLMRPADAKRLWSRILKRRLTLLPGILVVDDAEGQRLGLSFAYGISDGMGQLRRETVWQAAEEGRVHDSKASPPNRWVYDVVKAARASVV